MKKSELRGKIKNLCDLCSKWIKDNCLCGSYCLASRKFQNASAIRGRRTGYHDPKGEALALLVSAANRLYLAPESQALLSSLNLRAIQPFYGYTDPPD